MLTLEQAAERLAIAPATLYKWHAAKKGPVATMFGRLVRFRSDLLEEYIHAQTENRNQAKEPAGVAPEGRELALSVQNQRTRVHGQHKFRGHTTARERRARRASERKSADLDGRLAGAEDLPVQ
jgi:excisionase family DNA binding protein